jgi:hypothetical protein
VIAHDLHAIGIAVLPGETDSILIVDADAVLPLAIAGELLGPVGRPTARSLMACALLSIRSLRKATAWMSPANFRENSRWKTLSVSASANDLIIDHRI